MSMARRDEYADEGFRRLEVGVECGPSRVRRSMKDECDINRIMARYAKTGLISHVAAGKPLYMDVSAVGDYRSIVDRVAKADKIFRGLPAKVRAAFGNSPAAFLDACADPQRHGELVALGLVEAPPESGAAGGSSEAGASS